MLVEQYNSFGQIGITVLVSIIPILLFLICLTVLKMKGITTALINLVVTFVLVYGFFHLSFGNGVGSIIQGIIQGLVPIGYIIVMAVWLYKISVNSGKFDVLRSSIAGISHDQRIQLLLIGFCFNAFLEGAAGFGVPVAICAVLLMSLGFKPLQAAMLCLIANGASGAFGAIGIPVGIIDTFDLQEGISSLDVSRMTALTLPLINLSIPFLMVWLVDGFKGIKETMPAILITGITYAVSQALFTIFLGPEIADIVPPILAMGALALLCKKWSPKNTFFLSGHDLEYEKHTAKDIIKAWSPFYLLTLFILIWSLPAFKGLFAEGGALSSLVANFTIPGSEINMSLDIIGATGSALLVAVIVTILTTKNMTFQTSGRLLKETVKEFWVPIIMICAIIGIAKLMTYGGMTMALGEAAAKTGSAFPFISPILGWIGVFMTGSVVNNNTLFAPIQATAGAALSTNSTLLVAANTVGGVIAKLVSPQSIAIATAAVGQQGKESTLTKMTLKYSLGFLVFVCIWTFILSLIL
ncbi:L-lactate permease [Kurthia gibsonii]|uniref:L-lactate permease n=1 Tax=Kurthia gibsonii TaxID=33946 RepID=UPI0031B6AD38